MTAGSPAQREPEDQADSPTQAAHLKITAEPAGRISAEGSVPPADARHLITTFGVMGSVVASTAGMVLALHATPRYPYVALAALSLGLVSAVLIAVCGIVRRRERAMVRAPREQAGSQPAAGGERRAA